MHKNQVLACPGALPLDGYPSNFYRTNFTSLTQWCDQGCGCASPGSRPDCETSPITGKNFSTSLASQVCSSSCNCSPGNETLIGEVEDYPSILNNTDALYTQCPNGSFPTGKSAADFRATNLPVVNLGCESSNSSVWTLITFNFSPSLAQTCDPCPGGYGPDPDCVSAPRPSFVVRASNLESRVSSLLVNQLFANRFIFRLTSRFRYLKEARIALSL